MSYLKQDMRGSLQGVYMDCRLEIVTHITAFPLASASFIRSC